jgi:hypothetical protein
MERGAGVPRTSANAWDIDSRDVAKADRETRLSDFAAFVALSFPSFGLPLLGLPAGEVAMLALVATALFRYPDPRVAVPRVFVWGLALVPGWLLLSGVLNDALDERRLVHVAVFGLLGIHLATGRISIPSATRGLFVGLPAAVVASAAGGGVGVGYDDRLSGWIGDPNAAAYYVLTLGLLVVATRQRRVTALLFGAFIVASVYLTLSRTGIGVVLVAVVWLVIIRRLRLAGALAVVAAVAWVLENVPEDLRLWGPFAERAGSDALRQRIIAAEQLQLDAAPFWGNGPGATQVNVGDNEFFFHSSYYSVLNEGGKPLLVLVVVLVVATILVLGRRADRDWRIACLQMALIAPLLMAFTLGEVLLDLPVAVAIGMGLYRAYQVKIPDDPPGAATPLTAAAPALPMT